MLVVVGLVFSFHYTSNASMTGQTYLYHADGDTSSIKMYVLHPKDL